MILKSLSMRFVMLSMMDVEDHWRNSKWKDTGDLINPDKPMIIQVGDYGYEVQSCGGDGDIEGFVIMCKPEPVCKWEGMECIRLENKHDIHPPLKAKERLIRIMGTFDLATGHADTFDELLDSLESELRDVLGYYRQQRTWQGLTNDELTDLFYNTNLGQASAVAQAIALLKQKNGFAEEKNT